MEGLPIEPIEYLKPENLPLQLQTEIRHQDLVAGQSLFYQGDTTHSVYVVESGRIRLERYTPEGKFVTFQIVRPGESFAEIALFNDIYPCNAISEISSRVIIYPKQPLLNALVKQPELATELMRQMVKNIHALRIRLELREIRSAGDRILYYLRSIAEFYGKTFHFDRPLKMVASDIGLTPEVFYRTLANLEKDGTISRVKRQITLHDGSTA